MVGVTRRRHCGCGWCLPAASLWLVSPSGVTVVGVSQRRHCGWCLPAASLWLVSPSGVTVVGVTQWRHYDFSSTRSHLNAAIYRLKMKIFLLALTVVATASAAAIVHPPQQDNVFLPLNQNLIDLINSWNFTLKRSTEQDVFIFPITNIVNLLNGLSLKRNLPDIILPYFNQLMSKRGLTPLISLGDTDVIRPLDIFLPEVGKREAENVDITTILGQIGQVVHVIDQFVGGTAKRETENFDITTILGQIGQVVHVIDQFVGGTAKREVQNLTIIQLLEQYRQLIATSKREQDFGFDINRFVNTIEQAIHAVDQFIGGTGKRDTENLDITALPGYIVPYISQLMSRRDLISIFSPGQYTPIPSIFDLLGGAVGKRETENLDITTLLGQDQAQIVHVIDLFVGGTSKRETENFDITTILGQIAQVVHVIDQFVGGTAKREAQNLNITQLLQQYPQLYQVMVMSKREQDFGFDINRFVLTIEQAIHAVDQFIGGTAKRRAVAKRDTENFDITTILGQIGQVVHVIDQFVGGTAKREVKNLNITQLLQQYPQIYQVMAPSKREHDLSFDINMSAISVEPVIHFLDQIIGGTAKR
ncbi:hypothetical protein Btru_029698 [Bulinus truncatus]|nr:hypothetical protein Btru_029698 [Bulinus truncatus]